VVKAIYLVLAKLTHIAISSTLRAFVVLVSFGFNVGIYKECTQTIFFTPFKTLMYEEESFIARLAGGQFDRFKDKFGSGCAS